MQNKLAEPLQPEQPPQEPAPPLTPAWYSKLNWLGVITIIIGIMEYLKVNIDVLKDPDWNGIVTVITGILIIILRYFTSTPIATVKQLKAGDHKK